jgi:tetratricopeptide (TPR) repeat protein
MIWLCLIAFSSLVFPQSAVDRSTPTAKSPSDITFADSKDIAQSSDFSSRVLAELNKTFDQAFHLALRPAICGNIFLEMPRHTAEGLVRAQISSMLKIVAEAMVKAGLFDQSLQAAQSIPNYPERLQVLCNIAKAMMKVGQKEKAIAVLDQALQIAQNILDAYSRPSALCDIAKAMVEAGQKEKAATILDQALQFAHNISDASSCLSVLCDIAKAMAETGQRGKAATVLDQALRIAQSVSDDYRRSKALRSIVEAMAELGLLERAFEVAKGIEMPIHRLHALTTIVAEMRKAGKIK